MKLARIADNGSAVVVLRGSTDGVATVDGRTFDDLPELLAAAGGEASKIVPGQHVTVRDADLLSPVARPRKLVCIGLNYRAHAEESGAELPRKPIIFPKWDNCITGPFDDIPLPPESKAVDWESELAFVFGRQCRRVKAADAASVVFGFTAANDVSMRDYQFHTSQWGPGKCWDRSTPLGPVVVTPEEVGGATPDLAIRGFLNGKMEQDSRTNDLIFGVGELVEYITSIMTMEPGDIVLTGTPSGVGSGHKPRLYLKDGDVYEVSIEGIGSLRNRFVAEVS
jgi:acylpyruvate hydrolase